MLHYEYVKTIHVVLATFFFGGGAISAFFKIRSLKEKNLPTLLFVHQTIVAADYFFTIPAVIGLPLTGLWMAHTLGMDLSTPWLQWVFALYATAGIPWVPAAILQIKMKKLLSDAILTEQELNPRFHDYSTLWMILGIPSMLASIALMITMVTKFYFEF